MARWYRLALLLKGRTDAAEAAFLATCGDVAHEFDEIRNEKAQMKLFVRRLRERCEKAGDVREGDDNGTPPIALAISRLAEPMRSATALFFLRMFSAAEIAQTCGMSVDDLATLLGEARELLRRAGVIPEEAAVS